jgi:hypothetical protein
MTTTSDLPEVKALDFLYNQANAPLPFKKAHLKKDNSVYNFDSLKGTYAWNTYLSDFDYVDDKDIIDVQFHIPEAQNVKLKLFDFKSEAYSSKPDFPTKVISTLFIENEEKLDVSHVAEIEDKLIKSIRTAITGDGYQINLKLDRTKVLNDGTLKLNLEIKKSLSTLIDVEIIADISYSKQGFYYNNIQFDGHLFNHQIVGEIDYKNIDPTAEDYPKSFNANSVIEIFENANNKVGNIVLATTGNNDLQEFQIRFKNNDMVLLKEYLPVLDKLYNFKY